MLDPKIVLTVFGLYLGLLFLLALWVERKSLTGRSPADNPFVYSLSLAVYCAAWSYYGSVGKAATSGMLFLPIYLGPTIAIFLWWTVLRKLVRLKTTHRITSIADFISARYNKSQFLAAVVTVIALVGVVPYIALQLKAVISSFAIITIPFMGHSSTSVTATSWIAHHIDLIVVALMIVFTIVLGVRRLDPTERHEGMVMALAVQCLVKLVAFLAAGIFVTYYMYNGFSDLFHRLSESPYRDFMIFGGKDVSPNFAHTWTSYIILSMSAILFLPKQFHVAVVENSNEKHILTAMWLLPLYMLLINIFVFPIATGGLLKGYLFYEADTLILRLPFHYGESWLSLLVFIGGFSAAAGMIMTSSMTMATMITNHLLLPLVESIRPLSILKRHLLKCRWAAVAGYVLTGYWFEKWVGESYMLVHMGVISFGAVLQFAPAILGGVFWRRGDKTGAIAGLCAGFLVWSYTLLLPFFVKSGWIAYELLENGPWGIGLLKPEQLFGMSRLDPLSHMIFWSMTFNIGLYVLGSLCFEQSEEEQSRAEEFVDALTITTPLSCSVERDASIDLGVKKGEIENLLSQYFSGSEAAIVTEKCLRATRIEGKGLISIVELLEFHSEVEKSLAGSIGSAAAHKAVSQGTIFTPKEAKELSGVYEEILANLKISSTDLKRKLDYFQERLRLAEERYFHLVRHSPSLIYILRGDFRLDFINQACLMMLGYAPEEAMNIPNWFLDHIHPEDRERIQNLFQTAFKTGGSSFSAECRLIHKNGHSIHVIIKSIPSFGWERRLEVDRLQGIIVDVTDRVFLEKALAQKETLNTLRAISSEVAHEIRNPLMSIGGFARRLQKKFPDSSEPAIIMREAERMEQLLRRISDYLKPVEIHPNECSINAILTDCMELLTSEMNQKGVTYQLYPDPALSPIYADPEILNQIFNILTRNALEAMDKRGNLIIKTFESEQNIQIEFRPQVQKPKVKEPQLLFMPFDEAAQNIGLPLCYRLLKYMDGFLSVAQEQDGVVFTVSLPKRARPASDQVL